MSSRRLFWLAAAITAGLLAGCTSATTQPASPSLPAHSSTPRPDVSASPIAKTCGTLVSPSGLAALTSGGASENTRFAQKVRSEPDPQLNAFLDYGGIVCQWGDPAGEASCVLAESPITDAQKTAQQSALVAQGWKRLTVSGSDDAWGLVDPSTSMGNDPRTIFRGDKWVYALDESCLDYLA